MKKALLLPVTLIAALPLRAQAPLYLVNGEERSPEEAAALETTEVERLEVLPADEETIARYGERASGGVFLITLRYDTPAIFTDTLSFGDYIARRVKWGNDEPAARVVLRYRVGAEGRAEVVEVLEATDGRLKRRVLKAVAEAPAWRPALKEGHPVETLHVLRVRLPEGRPIPGEPYIRIR
ncbi:MAG: TonB-dependent receptor [Alistipes senegalensis]|nr:TonB-dependent receptor [Alistipes senegalensis]